MVTGAIVSRISSCVSNWKIGFFIEMIINEIAARAAIPGTRLNKSIIKRRGG
jgi:hypothetical protein